MIKPEQLRLGNFVKDRAGKTIRIDFFEYLNKDYDCKFGQNNFFNDDEVHPLTEYTQFAEPILLTKEWLIDLGFEFYTNANDEYLRKGSIYFYGKGLLCQIGEYNSLKISVRTVHQLQNIFYSLFGEELKKNKT